MVRAVRGLAPQVSAPLSTGADAPAPTTSPAASDAPEAASAPGAARTYTVKPGDNVSHIARDHRVSVNELLAANPQIRNPSLIHPGDELRLPEGARAPRSADHRRMAGARGGVDARTRNPALFSEHDTLTRGVRGPEVRVAQERLAALGYGVAVDGIFGKQTHEAVRAFQTANDLEPNGTVGASTWDALRSPDAKPANVLQAAPGDFPRLDRYPPGSPEQVALFRAAARRAGLPESWASSSGLQNILRRESNGRVGVPNYTYGARQRDPSAWAEIHNELKEGRITARSSATGLGQLLLSNVDRFYPSGRRGIGDPLEEAVGMMRYIRSRYGNPDRAWALYGTRHEGY